jgi:hypothetical protein
MPFTIYLIAPLGLELVELGDEGLADGVVVFHGGKCNLVSVVSFASRKLLKALGKGKLAKVLPFARPPQCRPKAAGVLASRLSPNPSMETFQGFRETGQWEALSTQVG